jgi:hypothetical protein
MRMYLFTRAGRFGPGSMRDAMSFTVEVTEKVRQETSLNIHAWQATMSPELGTVTWGAFVESLEELEAAQDKLAVSDTFIALAERGGKLLAGPLTDGLATVVHGAREPEAPLPSYISVARATATNGRLSDAIAAGIEIAETSTRITGIPTMFLANTTGPYGGFRWTSGAADIGALERAEAALMAEPAWVGLLDRVGTAYLNGATQSIYRRVV